MKYTFYILIILFTCKLSADDSFLIGVELGIGEGSEKFIGDNGDISVDFISQPSVKLTTAYKISDHHLRFSYLYNNLDNDDSYQALSIGYKYDFRGYNIIKNDSLAIIPTLSYDSGVSFEKERDLKGWINEIEAGFNFEFSQALSLTCNYSASVIFWDRDDRFDAIIDRVNERALKVGLLYTFGTEK